MSIFKMADLSHVGFLGSNNGFFEKPMYDFLYVVNRHHSSTMLSFLRKSRFFLYFGDRQTDKQTDKQMDSIGALSRSRCREQRLNKLKQITTFNVET